MNVERFASGAADWFERQIGKEIGDGHRRCLHVLSQICWQPGSLYNLPCPLSVTDSCDLWPTGGMSALTTAEVSTYDFDALTRLVVAAHRYHVRASVRAWTVRDGADPRSTLLAKYLNDEYGLDHEADDPSLSAGILEITLHPRQPAAEGDRVWERHPGLVDLANRCSHTGGAA